MDETSIPGGFAKMFRRAIGSGALSRCTMAGRALYPFLVWMADQRNQFIIDNASHNYLQKVAQQSPNTLRGAIQSLQTNGLLQILRPAQRPTATRPLGRAAVYQLLVPPERPMIDDDDELVHILKQRRFETRTNMGASSDPTTRRKSSQPPVKKRSQVPAPSARKKRTPSRNSSKTPAAAVDEVMEKARQRHVPKLGEGARLLIDAGLDQDLAVALGGKRSLFDLQVYVARSEDMDSPTGWLVSAIEKGYTLHKATVAKLKSAEREAATRDRVNRDMSAASADHRRRRGIDQVIDGWFDNAVTERVDALFDEFLGTLATRQRTIAERKRSSPSDCGPFRSFVAEKLQLA